MDFDNNELNLMFDNKKQINNEQIHSTTLTSIQKKPSHYPYSTQNPYDDGSLDIHMNSYTVKHLKKSSY